MKSKIFLMLFLATVVAILMNCADSESSESKTLDGIEIEIVLPAGELPDHPFFWPDRPFGQMSSKGYDFLPLPFHFGILQDDNFTEAKKKYESGAMGVAYLGESPQGKKTRCAVLGSVGLQIDSFQRTLLIATDVPGDEMSQDLSLIRHRLDHESMYRVIETWLIGYHGYGRVQLGRWSEKW